MGDEGTAGLAEVLKDNSTLTALYLVGKYAGTVEAKMEPRKKAIFDLFVVLCRQPNRSSRSSMLGRSIEAQHQPHSIELAWYNS